MNGDALELTGRGSWFVASTAEMPGEGALGALDEAEAFEQACLATQPAMMALLARERLTPARCALLLQPEGLSCQLALAKSRDADAFF